MKTMALVLIVLGVLTLVYGGVGYNRNRSMHEVDMPGVGSLSVTTSKRHDVRIPTAIGAIVLIGGVAMLMTNRRPG